MLDTVLKSNLFHFNLLLNSSLFDFWCHSSKLSEIFFLMKGNRCN